MTNNKKQILKLLKSAIYHLQQTIKMVEKRRHCPDIIQKSVLVQRYLRMADKEILSGHLKRCVKKVLNDEDQERQLQEILRIFKRKVSLEGN